MASFLYRGILDVFGVFAGLAMGIFSLCLWIIKFAIWLVRAFGRGFLAIGRPAMRFLAFILFIVAAVACIADLTPYLDHGSPIDATAVSEHWKTISPLSLTAAKFTVTSSVGEWAWNIIDFMLLSLPTFIVFGGFGFLAAYLGKKRGAIEVYVN